MLRGEKYLLYIYPALNRSILRTLGKKILDGASVSLNVGLVWICVVKIKLPSSLTCNMQSIQSHQICLQSYKKVSLLQRSEFQQLYFQSYNWVSLHRLHRNQQTEWMSDWRSSVMPLLPIGVTDNWVAEISCKQRNWWYRNHLYNLKQWRV